MMLKFTEVDMEDKIVEVITLTDTPKKKTEETSSQKVTNPPTQSITLTASTSKRENIVVTDIIPENIAQDSVVEKDEGADLDKTMSISRTSMADYDRDETEDLVAKIALCHTALAKHYEDINGIIPHMTKTQMATYLVKIPVVPLVKPEAGPVKKLYSAEDTLEDEHVFPVVGETWEDKLKYLVNHVPAEKLMFAIAIGDLQLNQTSQAKISMKYGFPKTRIQRTMSQDPAHCKGGHQYQVEQQKKRKVAEKEQTKIAEEIPAKKSRQQLEIPLEVLLQHPDNELLDIPLDEDDEDLPDIHIN